MQRERVARNLRDDPRGTRVAKRSQQALDVVGKRRRVLDRLVDHVAKPRTERADEAERSAGRHGNRFDEMRGRRFAVRAGDADNRQ